MTHSHHGLKGALASLLFLFLRFDSNLPYSSSRSHTSTHSDIFFAAGTLNSWPANLAVYTESRGDVPAHVAWWRSRSEFTQVRPGPPSFFPPLVADFYSMIERDPVQPHTIIHYAVYCRLNVILSWDVRSDINAPLMKCVTPHVPTTNQNKGFEIDMWKGSRVVVGDQGGPMSVFGLSSGAGSDVGEEAEAHVKNPDFVFDTHVGK